MKFLRYLLPILLMGLSAVTFAGDIQVLCEPGLRVYVDDEFVGTSSAREDGLAVTDIRPGKHLVRVEKDGFLSQTFEVEILDLPIELRVGEFSPTPPAREEIEPDDAEVKQLVGSLVITSVPQNCDVEIDGKTESKDEPQVVVGGLAAGEHTISFSKPGYDPISSVIDVHAGAELNVRGDLKSGKVEVVHKGRGMLIVESNPMHCMVSFMGEIRTKSRTHLKMKQLPAGEHPITVSIQGRDLSTNVLIMNRMKTILEVSFVKGEEPFVVSYESE